VRAESQPDFAVVLDEATAPTQPTPTGQSDKTAKSTSPEASLKEADDSDSEARVDTDATVPTPALIQLSVAPPIVAPVPVPEAKVAATPTPDPSPVADTDTAPPAIPPVATLPMEAAASPQTPVQPAPSAAPAVLPPPVADPEGADPALEGSASATEAASDETVMPDMALLASLEAAPAPTRVRDTIEQAKVGNAASVQTPSALGQAASSESDSGAMPATPSPLAGLADAAPAPAKPAEAAPAAVQQLDPVEPTQSLQSFTPTETRAAQAAGAETPALSGMSQGAIHATAQIAAQIVKRLERRSTRFEMALTPDDLGRIDVSLDIDAQGQLSARLAFDNPLAAADLRGRVDELRRQLTDAGFVVADDALSFEQREPSTGAGGFDRGHDRQYARAFGAASRLSAEAEASLIPPRWMSFTLTPERVDMKV